MNTKENFQKDIDRAIKVAEGRIEKGYPITNYCIRQNIQMVESDPEKFGAEFIKIYS